MASNNNAVRKKMSLEEFLDDSSLNDSAWNEDEIDLNAISTTLSNTTSLDLLKSTSMGHGGMNSNEYPAGGFANGHHFHGSNRQYEPPYIIKFSNLPSKFSNFEIEDLFRTKFTRFVKFKMFWELNKNPPLDSVSVFDKNFVKSSKVAFVEVFSFRDMDKIMSQWKGPLMELYAIKVDPAEFSDFQNYVNKNGLLTPSCPDAGKSYVPPSAKPERPPQRNKIKSNPFGDAKPVDTQTKILQIEETVEKFHIEDTTSLRKISFGEATSPELKKVTLLKREQHSSHDSQVFEDENDDTAAATHTARAVTSSPATHVATHAARPAHAAHTAHAVHAPHAAPASSVKKGASSTTEAKVDPPKLKLKFSEVLQKAAKERDEASAAASAASLKSAPPSSSLNTSAATTNSSPSMGASISESNREQDDDGRDSDGHQSGSKFVFKDSSEIQHKSFNYRGGHRGGAGSRGGNMRRGNSRGGGHRGNYDGRGGSHHNRPRDNAIFDNTNGNDTSSKSFDRNYNDANNGTNRHYNNNHRRHSNDGGHKPQNMYSLFRPAAGFLLGDNGGNNNSNRDSSRGGRGGRGRGRGRGGH